MRVGLFPATASSQISWLAVESCPLCQGRGTRRASLQRREYNFGRTRIPLPPAGVALDECTVCGLLYKNLIPDPESLSRVLRQEAVNEWRPKRGPHPSLGEVTLYSGGPHSALLDIGASNGDLLRAVAPYFGRLSAFDIVPYPQCAQAISGEYIIGNFEDRPDWSRMPYDVVTAFDVFEHFANVGQALDNVVRFLKPGGYLVVETGDWHTAARYLPNWYYCNLLEHQIFWSRSSFIFACAAIGLKILVCKNVNHKSRRNMPWYKATAVRAYRAVGEAPGVRPLLAKAIGIDPRLVPPPRLQDHLFVVAQRASL